MSSHADGGKTIREARIALGWSQSRLAEVLNEAAGHTSLDRQYISRWERGARRPDSFWLRHLERVLGVTIGATAPEVEDDDMRRRALLALVAGTMLTSSVDAPETVRRGVDAVIGRAPGNENVDDWDHAVQRYSQRVNRSPAEAIMPDLLRDLDELRVRLEPATGNVRFKLLAACALLSGFACDVAGQRWLLVRFGALLANRPARRSRQRRSGCALSNFK